MSTTSIQKLAAIRKGSVRVLIGDDFDSLVDIGALRDPIINSLAENQSVEFDNTDPLRKFVRGDRVQVTFNLAEINLSTIAKLDAGIVELTTVAGSLVEDEEQVVASGGWNYEAFIEIANQNGNGSAIVVNSVTGGTDGALTVDVDFHVIEVNGKYGIVIHDTTDVTTLNQTITIDYDYTPNAAKRLSFNSSGNKTLKCMRIINIDENDKQFRIDIEEGTNFAPISFDFASDVEDDVAIQGIDFQGVIADFYDEQQVD